MVSTPSKPSENQVQSLFNESFIAKTIKDYPHALRVFQQALRAAPQKFLNPDSWAAIFNPPEWFAGDDEAVQYLDYAYGVMDELLSLCTEQPQLSQKLALAFIGKSHFRQTTQNYRNLSPLMCHRAAIFRLALSSLEPLMNYEFPTPVSAGKKIRYGIILKHLIQDPETIGALSYFEFAHALDIEVIIFVCKDATQPGFVERVRAVSNQIMSLPAALPSAIETLRKADLDILFYANDVTAKPSLPALLTFFRVARRTFTCVSTIATTQAPFVDAYMGGKYFHEMGYAGEFSERFISLPFPGFSFSIPVTTEVNVADFDVSQFGIPAKALVLASGANHHKISGPLLKSWAAILKQLDQAYLLLYPFPPHYGAAQMTLAKHWYQLFANEGISAERVKILPSLGSREAVIALLRGVDIGLDSFPYSGLTTIVDAMEASLPIVVPSGPVLRNNHGAAILDSVGARELIAKSEEDYVRLAVELGLDACKRAELRSRITEAMNPRPSFLDPNSYCREVIKACRMLYQEMRTSGKT
jgi:predicted O-linked N-acetylglucosamine transferase (SPINDLY family)